jgi:hypothetical protein
MDGALVIALIAIAVTVPAMLAQELARGAAAILLTRGRVCVLLGHGRPLFSIRLGRLLVAPTSRWWWGGECLHAAATSRRRSTAILLTGPLVADACFALAALDALWWPTGANDHPVEQLALWLFALVALVRGTTDLVVARGDRVRVRLAVAAR